jgi:hypothetical protein
MGFARSISFSVSGGASVYPMKVGSDGILFMSVFIVYLFPFPPISGADNSKQSISYCKAHRKYLVIDFTVTVVPIFHDAVFFITCESSFFVCESLLFQFKRDAMLSNVFEILLVIPHKTHD